MDKHTIVPARISGDREDFRNLYIMSAPEYIPALFGGTQDKVTKSLFRYGRNLFSFEHTLFAQVNGKNAGMLLGYDWRTQKKESDKTSMLMVRYMKTKFITQIQHLAWASSVLTKIDDGTFYISNLAVYPEYRRNGLGTSLLSHAEQAAIKLGAKSLELDVEADNENAIRLYRKFGMNIIGEPKGTVIDGEEFEFFRMTKNISPQP